MVYSQRYLVVAWLLPRETAGFSTRQVVCAVIQPYTSLQWYFIQTHIGRVDVGGCGWMCGGLAVSCHLTFGRNDRDLLRATAVTRGSNEYRNKPESAQKVDLGEENSPAAHARTRTRDLSISSPAL